MHRYYVIGIVICPMIFYIPKFFELRTDYQSVSLNVAVDCEELLFSVPFNGSEFRGGDDEATSEAVNVAAAAGKIHNPFTVCARYSELSI